MKTSLEHFPLDKQELIKKITASIVEWTGLEPGSQTLEKKQLNI